MGPAVRSANQSTRIFGLDVDDAVACSAPPALVAHVEKIQYCRIVEQVYGTGQVRGRVLSYCWIICCVRYELCGIERRAWKMAVSATIHEGKVRNLGT